MIQHTFCTSKICIFCTFLHDQYTYILVSSTIQRSICWAIVRCFCTFSDNEKYVLSDREHDSTYILSSKYMYISSFFTCPDKRTFWHGTLFNVHYANRLYVDFALLTTTKNTYFQNGDMIQHTFRKHIVCIFCIEKPIWMYLYSVWSQYSTYILVAKRTLNLSIRTGWQYMYILDVIHFQRTLCY